MREIYGATMCQKFHMDHQKSLVKGPDLCMSLVFVLKVRIHHPIFVTIINKSGRVCNYTLFLPCNHSHIYTPF